MQKLYNISLLRLFAMLLLFFHHVVCGLCLDGDASITYFPMTFGVEVFLFVSAYLYANKPIANFKQFFKKRFLFVFLPYYLVLFVVFLLYLVFMSQMISGWEVVKGVFCLYIFDSSYSSLGHFWFLPIIMICYCLLPLLQKLYNNKTSQKTKNLLKIFFGCIVIFELCFSCLGHHLQFSAFFAGFFVAKNKDYKTINPFCSLLVFVLCVVVYLFVHGFGALGENSFLQNGIGYCLMFLTAISFSLFVLNVFDFLNKKPHKFLDFADKISYPFYLVHHILLIKAFSLLGLTPYVWLNTIFALGCSIYFATLLWLATSKIQKLVTKKQV